MCSFDGCETMFGVFSAYSRTIKSNIAAGFELLTMKRKMKFKTLPGS
jgi:hypothetical protein